MSFKEVRKVNVSDEVYKQILNEIVNKNLRPGDKLPTELELGQTFGVSRVSVRAALQRLMGAGIIESVNGGGTYVKHLPEVTVLSGIMPMVALGNYNTSHIVDYRRSIEVVSAELAARLGIDEDIAELREIHVEMEDANKAGDVEKYSELDLDFHMCIARMSKNPFIIYSMEQLKDIFFMHISKLNQVYGCNDGFNYHGRILDMIASHNQQGAREYMNLNLLNTQQKVLEWEDDLDD